MVSADAVRNEDEKWENEVTDYEFYYISGFIKTFGEAKVGEMSDAFGICVKN